MVQLHLYPAFMPKVVSQFHVNQDILLPVVFPKPQNFNKERHLHALDVGHALGFYLERIKPFRRSSQLFIAEADRMKGLLVSSQSILSWITTHE